MSKRILVEKGEAREIAVMDGQRLLAYYKEAPGKAEAEQIYLAVVDRIVKGMEAAFVRLGPDLNGFLPFAECREKPRSGDKLLLQVKKPPVGDKAPYLTADIALAGRYLILTPMTGRFAVSKKITEEAARASLLEAAQRLAPPSMGLVMRTESAGASRDELLSDVNALRETWEKVLQKKETSKAPCLLLGRESVLSRVLRDEHGEIEGIWTNEASPPPVSLPVHLCDNPFALYNVRAKLDKALQRKVWLDCGGYLIIDRTEAMTVIDVNSGKYAGDKSGAESAFLRLNLEAAREIARLLRLRGIGGIVIADFVDMQSEAHRQLVSAALEEALRDDPVKNVVHGFTHLGLVEMTRKKTDTAI